MYLYVCNNCLAIHSGILQHWRCVSGVDTGIDRIDHPCYGCSAHLKGGQEACLSQGKLCSLSLLLAVLA